jgi:hypothetical protein
MMRFYHFLEAAIRAEVRLLQQQMRSGALAPIYFG